MINSRPELSGALQDPVTSQVRFDIVNHLWRSRAEALSRHNEFDWDAYFAYYTRECTAALIDEGSHLSARTHQHLLNIAHLLEDESTEEETRRKLRQTLTTRRCSADEKKMLDGSIKLAARVLAMVSIGPLPSEISGKHSLPWHQGSFQDAVHSYFKDPPEIDLDPKDDIIGTDLTCHTIERVSGIEVILTDNLVDHLRLVEGDKKLCVFHHASFLKTMIAVESPMFQDGFIKETLDTLALLFPESDRKTKRWLSNKARASPSSAPIDRELIKCGHFRVGHRSRRLERYQFWRDRLVLLKEAVEDARPTATVLVEALRDSRKSERWLSSWIAIVAIGLTLFFGLVQSVEGAVQVYKAYHPEEANPALR